MDQNQGELSPNPPAATVAASSDQRGMGFETPTRSITVRAGNRFDVNVGDVVPGSEVEYATPNVKGGRTLPGVAPSPDSPVGRYGYMGTKLVDRNGAIAREQYDPSKEAYGFLASMDSGERVSFLRQLQSRGLIGKGDVTARFTNANIGAAEEFLMYANSQLVTADVALGMFLADPNIPAVSTGGRIRTTPKEDLRAVFREASRKYLGREVSAAEVEKFVNSYNAKEIAEGSGGAVAPSATTAAETMVQQSYGEEAAAVKALNFMDILDQKIKALA